METYLEYMRTFEPDTLKTMYEKEKERENRYTILKKIEYEFNLWRTYGTLM